MNRIQQAMRTLLITVLRSNSDPIIKILLVNCLTLKNGCKQDMQSCSACRIRLFKSSFPIRLRFSWIAKIKLFHSWIDKARDHTILSQMQWLQIMSIWRSDFVTRRIFSFIYCATTIIIIIEMEIDLINRISLNHMKVRMNKQIIIITTIMCTTFHLQRWIMNSLEWTAE